MMRDVKAIVRYEDNKIMMQGGVLELLLAAGCIVEELSGTLDKPVEDVIEAVEDIAWKIRNAPEGMIKINQGEVIGHDPEAGH